MGFEGSFVYLPGMNEAPSPSDPTARQRSFFLPGFSSKAHNALAAALRVLSSPAGLAIFVFLIGFAATLFTWRTLERREDRLVVERFDSLAKQLLFEMKRQQGVHEQSLRAGAALASIVENLTATTWRSIYDNLRVASILPGVQGYGFAAAVPANDLAAHIEKIRDQGFPRYEVNPAGARDFYTPIAFLEPFDARNQRAHGYDMFSDAERRAAMVRAAETGATAATGRLRLMQETDSNVQAGFLMYVPVYRGDRGESVPVPLRSLVGFVYSPVRVSDFFDAILDNLAPSLRRFAAIEVFDGRVPSPEALMYSSGGRGVAGFTAERTHDLFGREWTVRMSPLPAFLEGTDRRARREILFGGLAISLMAGALAWLVMQRQRQREEAALRNDMVAREMSHRVKNLLAVIQSIASRTLSGGRSLQDARSVFSDRLSALARAHSALVDGQWSGASLRELLSGELAPFGARVTMSGPFVRLNASMAQNMAMAVHELATNAVKYGALSDAAGKVTIVWAVRNEPAGAVFSFSWKETGGPPASQPEREGFGQTLLRRLIGSSIGADPVTDYAPEGFGYSFECPLERVTGAEADRRAA